jgi:hypothetical protein
MILDLCLALADLLEPDPEPPNPQTPAPPNPIHKVVLDTEPLIWEKEHLYIYPLRVAEEAFETGPSRLQRFDVNVVYITDSGDEARLERDPALALALDAKRGSYMSAVRTNYHTTVWEHLTALADNARPRGLDKRSAAVRVSGWRIVN